MSRLTQRDTGTEAAARCLSVTAGEAAAPHLPYRVTAEEAAR